MPIASPFSAPGQFGPELRGARAAQVGILVNAVLAVAKLIAGLVGNSFALVADAIESTADIVSSAIVWGGLRVAAREPDDVYPFGYGKAESLAAAAVALMIIGAAVAIAIAAVGGIRAPHDTPAAWTLAVLVGVMLIKWLMARYVDHVGLEIGSGAVRADAWHHRSDAITSAAAFVGISLAVAGGPGWQSADDWAALVASLVILYNGIAVLRPAINDLMDRTPESVVVSAIEGAARNVPGVMFTEKLAVRRSGLAYRATIHVQADAGMTLREAHVLSGRVKGAIKAAVPRVQQVLVHMEPFEEKVG
ncbi:MAG: cation diffusion facilitator family transporter [Gemmatimonadota bacterium]